MREPLVDALGVYDQGQIGSCTANGSLAAFRWLYARAGKAAPDFSRLAQYAWTRDAEGTPLSEDSGCSIRDAIATLHQVGACPEPMWAYDVTLFDMEPPSDCKTEAAKHETLSYHAVPNLAAIKREVFERRPVVFGFSVFQGMMSDECARTGVIPAPAPDDQPVGGHCMTIVGYCDERQAVLCLNSWGSSWGDGGLCWLPYRYITSGLASDFWVLRAAEGVES